MKKKLKVLSGSKKYILFFIIVIILFTFFIYQITKNDINNVSSLIQTTNTLNTSNNSEESVEELDPKLFIEGLILRDFEGGEIKIESTLSQNDSYSSYIISYPSDNLKIYGRMNVPKGSGPFPVILLNHGYFNTSTYNSGDGTQGMADILARNDYITLASDYRGFGKSEDDGGASRGHRPDYAIDILNLIPSIDSLSNADPTRIGMWGHSMGGEVTLRTAEATEDLDAIVLWAPTSARASDNAGFYGGRRNNNSTNNNSSELDGISPINYLEYLSAPISLHQGLSDNEVDPIWSKELNNALLKEGKTVEYFEYPEQDHNFRNLGWDVISKRTVEFFDRYLK